jgi:hypothetical protein
MSRQNAVAALHAWSLLHDVTWMINQRVITGLLKGSAALADDQCTLSPRLPVLLRHLELIAADIDHSLPLNVAWLACALTVFWGIARVGELVIPTFDDFEPGVHIAPKDVHVQQNPNGLTLGELRVPRTKTPRDGEVVCFAPRSGSTDPGAALRSHLAINQSADDGPLFAFRCSGSSNGESRRPSRRTCANTVRSWHNIYRSQSSSGSSSAFPCLRLAKVSSRAHFFLFMGPVLYPTRRGLLLSRSVRRVLTRASRQIRPVPRTLPVLACSLSHCLPTPLSHIFLFLHHHTSSWIRVPKHYCIVLHHCTFSALVCLVRRSRKPQTESEEDAADFNDSSASNEFGG